MKGTFLILFLFGSFLLSAQKASIFVEAEGFSEKGGWVVDQQFMDLMGSSYLMAHGMGVPVADAKTTISVPSVGNYNVFVRTFNWTSPFYKGEGPGKFQILINGNPVGDVLGNSGSKWMWQRAGVVALSNTSASVCLHDLTGFNGRVDAIFLTKGDVVPPAELKSLSKFRKKFSGLPKNPEVAGEFDLVVVGGGVAGVCAAIAGARLGIKVALIQDRPVLGGNNSSEVRVHLGGRVMVEPNPALGQIVNEIGPARGGNAQPAAYYEDDKKMKMVLAEENITLFTNLRAFDVKMSGSRITQVLAKHIETSEEWSFSAPLFADCTGDGTIGYLGGADFAMGREGRDEYGEPSAPEVADAMTMGASVQWYSVKSEKVSSFPQFQYGVEFNEGNAQQVTMGEWTWETGGHSVLSGHPFRIYPDTF